MVDERLSPAKIKARDTGAKDSRTLLLNGVISRFWKHADVVRYSVLGADISWIASPEL